jgi:hypothetical protein
LTTNIFLFLNHEISIEDFEKWVYRYHKKIAFGFGEDVSLSLVEFNYKCSGASSDLEKIIQASCIILATKWFHHGAKILQALEHFCSAKFKACTITQASDSNKNISLKAGPWSPV